MAEGLQQVTMTVTDAATVLGVKPRVVRNFIRKGALPAIYLGTKPLVLKEGIDRLLDDARAAAAAARHG